MKIIKCMILSVLLVGANNLLSAQQTPKTEKLQEFIKISLAKAYAASVFLADYDTVTNRTTGSRFSGVVVSRDGLILTAAHVGMPGKVYQVVFPDGKEYIATGLGRIQQFDAAMLKINRPGKWPYAEMGWSSSLKLNEPLISIAYPGSFNPKRLIVRFGYVAEKAGGRRGMIRSTCLMEPGDSGGPVFDLYGRVVGVHSNITLPLDVNMEVPVDVFRKYWTALLKPEDYKEPPPEEPMPVDPLKDNRIFYQSIDGVSKQLTALEAKLDDHTIQLRNTSDSTTVIGTLVNAEELKKKITQRNKTLIVSKNSLVKEGVLAWLDDNWVSVDILYRDEKQDLVLLQLNRKVKAALRTSNFSADTISFTGLGTILISPHPNNEGELSIVGSLEFDLPGLYSVGYLGSGIEIKDGKSIVTMVQPNSPALQAGISVGDEIFSINDVQIVSPEIFSKEIQKNKPGDEILLIYKRSGQEHHAKLTLGKRPLVTKNHVAERFLDGKSDRRDGFKNAYVHDSKLKPSECGGPVFDIKGKFMGINMARYSRASSIAVSPEEIMDFLNNGLTSISQTATR